MARVLYITYDGVLEPLGQSQVLAYLERLAQGHEINLISFEKEVERGDARRVAAMRERLKLANIAWTPLKYHKTPSAPATAYDIAIGTIVALWIVLTRRVEIIHARSYVPALMAVVVKRLTGAKFLFDMRGFWADERTDGGLWPEGGRLWRVTKALERRFLLAADHVVTLTHASRRVIEGFDYLQGKMPPVSVISTCADLERFRPTVGVAREPFIFGYVGSVGTWYLFDETLAFFKVLAVRRPDARLLVVNRNEHAEILAAVERAGISSDRVQILSVEHKDVPEMIGRMHAAAALIRPCFSKLASAPTKLAEYLGCGVPCVGNVGVGDMQEILEGNQVGVALNDFSPADLAGGADRLLALIDDVQTAPRCVETARRIFSLADGVDAYRAIYQSLQEFRLDRSQPNPGGTA